MRPPSCSSGFGWPGSTPGGQRVKGEQLPPKTGRWAVVLAFKGYQLGIHHATKIQNSTKHPLCNSGKGRGQTICKPVKRP